MSVTRNIQIGHITTAAYLDSVIPRSLLKIETVTESSTDPPAVPPAVPTTHPPTVN